jgi:hypothetical protein
VAVVVKTEAVMELVVVVQVGFVQLLLLQVVAERLNHR